MVMAGVAWGDGIIHLECRPLNPVIGQSYTFGNDPNTHTYIGGDGWYSTCLHWTETTGEPVKFKRVNQPRTNEMKAVSLSLMTDTNGPGRTTTTPEQIRNLAESGKICEAMGFHCWEPDLPQTCYAISYPAGEGPPVQRKCKLCGKVETEIREWK